MTKQTKVAIALYLVGMASICIASTLAIAVGVTIITGQPL